MRLLVLLLLTSSLRAQTSIPLSSVPDACGSPEIEFSVKADKGHHTIARPENEKAIVYFIEEYHSHLGALFIPTVRLGIDGTWVGANRGESYFSFTVEPGKHQLCASWQSPNENISSQYSLLSFTAEEGKIYFFRIEPRAEAYHDHGDAWNKDLGPIDTDRGKNLVSSIPLSVYRANK